MVSLICWVSTEINTIPKMSNVKHVKCDWDCLCVAHSLKDRIGTLRDMFALFKRKWHSRFRLERASLCLLQFLGSVGGGLLGLKTCLIPFKANDVLMIDCVPLSWSKVDLVSRKPQDSRRDKEDEDENDGLHFWLPTGPSSEVLTFLMAACLETQRAADGCISKNICLILLTWFR